MLGVFFNVVHELSYRFTWKMAKSEKKKKWQEEKKPHTRVTRGISTIY